MRWRASATRSATTELGSVNLLSLSSSALPTGRNSAFMSTRSSSGPDRRARYLRRTSGVQEHAAREDVAFEQGHGLAASTSVNLAGKRAVSPQRASTTSPDSSGWRSASSTSLENSGASSRNRNPWCANEAAPGCSAPVPPPTIAALVEVWWGAQNGGSV